MVGFAGGLHHARGSAVARGRDAVPAGVEDRRVAAREAVLPRRSAVGAVLGGPDTRARPRARRGRRGRRHRSVRLTREPLRVNDALRRETSIAPRAAEESACARDEQRRVLLSVSAVVLIRDEHARRRHRRHDGDVPHRVAVPHEQIAGSRLVAVGPRVDVERAAIGVAAHRVGVALDARRSHALHEPPVGELGALEIPSSSASRAGVHRPVELVAVEGLRRERSDAHGGDHGARRGRRARARHGCIDEGRRARFLGSRGRRGRARPRDQRSTPRSGLGLGWLGEEQHQRQRGEQRERSATHGRWTARCRFDSGPDLSDGSKRRGCRCGYVRQRATRGWRVFCSRASAKNIRSWVDRRTGGRG